MQIEGKMMLFNSIDDIAKKKKKPCRKEQKTEVETMMLSASKENSIVCLYRAFSMENEIGFQGHIYIFWDKDSSFFLKDEKVVYCEIQFIISQKMVRNQNCKM